MCGIAGVLALDGRVDAAAADALIESMTRALAHRGPDAQRTASAGPLRLGHRRLSVIDPSPAAHQPMCSEDGTLWIVLNGEIYDHAEQRRRLEAQGHRFRTRSDTEVALALYREHGVACVEHLHGMFALAVWDQARRRLFLARDRIGKKPLYYHVTRERFFFASEIKALLCDPALPRDLDPRAVLDFLSFDYVPAPGTIYGSIRQLPPAHAATVDERGLRLWRYWDLEQRPAAAPDTCAAAVEIVRRLGDAVEARLVADVPIGVFLSGGIDSASIVALLRARRPQLPIRTFTLGFAEPGRDERPNARLVARAFGTEHHELEYSPRFDDHLDEVIAHFDQPFADPAMLPTWELARQARAEITVALTGEGGDEALAGYDRYVKSALARAWYRVPRPLRRTAARLLDRLAPETAGGSGLGARLRAFMLLGELPPADLFGQWLLHFSEEAKREVCTGDLLRAAGGHDSREHLRRLYAAAAGDDRVNELLDVDLRSYLPDDLLVKVDMATMRHGLEARCPFLDPELLGYLRGLPGHMKLRGLTTKWILRRAMRPLLPAAILRRPKLGFGPPVHLWLRGALRERARDVLTDRRTRERGFFEPHVLERLLDEHDRGRRNHGYQLWNLLVLEIWLRARESATAGGASRRAADVIGIQSAIS